MTPDSLAVVLNAAILAAVLQAAGSVFFLRLFRAELGVAATAVRRLVRTAAIAGVVLVLFRQGIEAARFAGEFAGISNAQLQHLAWISREGAVSIAQTLALGLIVVFTSSEARRVGRLVVFCAIAATAAFAATGHSSTHDAREWLVPLLAVHTLAGAFWFGSLAPLLIAIRKLPAETISAVLTRFSRIARWSVIALAVAGITVAVTLSPGFAVLDRAYGKLLLLKAFVLVALVALALFNRMSALPRLLQRQPRAANTLRTTIAAEIALMALVLSATALLTTLFSPDG